MLNVIKAKPKLVLHIVGGAIIIFQSVVRRSRGVIFAKSDFGIAQNHGIGLHCPTSFAIVQSNLAMCQ